MTSKEPRTTNASPVLAKRTTCTTIIEGLGVLHRRTRRRMAVFAGVAMSFVVGSAVSAGPPAKGRRPSAMPHKTLRTERTAETPSARPNRIRARPAAPKDRDLGAPYDRDCPGVETLVRRKGRIPFTPGEELSYELSVRGAYVAGWKPKSADRETSRADAISCSSDARARITC